MKKAQAPEESGEKAPLWIISFADMISLLMAFFVMLQTMASEHTNELFTTGRGKFVQTMGEFRRNINGFGIPGLFGDSMENNTFSTPMRKYHFDSQTSEPIINPATNGDEEKMRRLFTDLSRQAKTDRAQLRGKIQDYKSIPVGFTPAGDQLDAETMSRLSQHVSVLSQAPESGSSLIYYVVGAAPSASSPSEQWILSEKQARKAADFLRKSLPESMRENIYSWGAGAGEVWLASADDTKGVNSVLIVTLLPPAH